MTGPKKKMLAKFAAGTDVNTYSQVSAIMSSKREHAEVAGTIMALLRAKMLQHSKSGGLEISDLGRETAAKIKKAEPR